jgi:hypothetical protein
MRAIIRARAFMSCKLSSHFAKYSVRTLIMIDNVASWIQIVNGNWEIQNGKSSRKSWDTFEAYCLRLGSFLLLTWYSLVSKSTSNNSTYSAGIGQNNWHTMVTNSSTHLFKWATRRISFQLQLLPAISYSGLCTVDYVPYPDEGQEE